MALHRRTVIAALTMMATPALIATTALARHDKHRDWELLGSKQVGFLIDKDVIQVGRVDGDFSKIKLRVKNNDVHMMDLKIVYGNGQQDDIPVRNEIKAGSETRAIDLKGGDRIIKRVELAYRSKPSFKGQAVVELWGKD